MESLRIVIATVAAAVAYGIVHDQLTARICLEYFTIGHPRLFAGNSPTLHALAWGVLATWWMGLVIGAALAVAARVGGRPKLALPQIRPMLLAVVGASALSAVIAGLSAWALVSSDLIELGEHFASRIPAASQSGFVIDAWVHLASYAMGAVGGVTAAVWIWVKRGKLMGSSLQPST